MEARPIIATISSIKYGITEIKKNLAPLTHSKEKIEIILADPTIFENLYHGEFWSDLQNSHMIRFQHSGESENGKNWRYLSFYSRKKAILLEKIEIF